MTFLLLTIMATSLFADTAAIGGLIKIRLLKHEPSPAEPGAYADVWVSISNAKSSNTADNVYCEITDTYPFTIDDEKNARKEIGNLAPGYDASLKWKILVDENAVPGNNELDITCKHDNYPSVTLKADIYVQPTEATITIENTEIPVMTPGQQSELKINLKNLAAISVKEVTIKLDLTDLSFAPIGSTSEKQIKMMAGGEEKTVLFTLITYPKAQPGVYKIPITMTYYDRLGKKYEKQDVLGVLVDAETNIQINLEESNVYSAEKNGEITLELVNRGLEDIKFLSLKIIPNKAYQITSSNEVYIGEMSSDDSSSADFNIYIEKTNAKEVPLELELNYADAFNQQQTKKITTNIPLYSDKELAELGIVPITEMDLMTTLIITIIGLYVIYKAYKRFKKK